MYSLKFSFWFHLIILGSGCDDGSTGNGEHWKSANVSVCFIGTKLPSLLCPVLTSLLYVNIVYAVQYNNSEISMNFLICQGINCSWCCEGLIMLCCHMKIIDNEEFDRARNGKQWGIFWAEGLWLEKSPIVSHSCHV